jgi:hypothetical protein
VNEEIPLVLLFCDPLRELLPPEIKNKYEKIITFKLLVIETPNQLQHHNWTLY